MGALERVFRGRRGGQERPAAAIVAGLWRNGEQGVWYDPDGFRAAWSDVGPERLANASFDDGLTGWQVFQPAGSTVTASGGALTFISDGGTYAAIQQSGVLEVGAWYQVSIDVISGSGAAKVVGIDTEVPFTGSITFIGRATLSTFSIARNGAVNAVIGSVSVKPWNGLSQCQFFQDMGGTIPVYLPGKGKVDAPLGLILDKSRGMALGPELSSDPDFDNPAAWVNSGAGDPGTVAGGVLTFEVGVANTTAARWKTNGSRLAIGTWYVAEIVVTAVTAPGGLGLDIGGAVFAVSTPGTYRRIVQATTSALQVMAVAIFAGTISRVSVKKLFGNHRWQGTTTSRPTLSARYNLLTSSENLASVWSVFNGAFTQAGDYWKFTENTTANLHSFLQTPSQPKAALYTATFTGKPAGRSIVRFVLNAYSGNFCEVRFNLATGTVVGTFTGGDGVVSSYSITPVGDGGYSCTMVGKPSAAASGTSFDVSLGLMDGTTSSYAGDGVSGILVNKFDCRSANDGVGLPPYQRVVDATTYDTVGFPLYIKTDGIDDWLQTASVDFSGTNKVFVAAAARRLVDGSSAGTFMELSPVTNTNTGSFALFAPLSTITPGFALRYSGAMPFQDINVVSSGPVSGVLLGSIDLGAGASFSVNTQKSSNPSTSGGGSFGNYSLYFYRRAGTSLPFNGRDYGTIIVGRELSVPETRAVEKYLNSKARAY